MKGIVFTNFFELVTQAFGEDMVDDIIDDANPPQRRRVHDCRHLRSRGAARHGHRT